MYLWFYACDPYMRHQANLDRLNLVFRCSPGGCYGRIKEYIDNEDPEAIRKQLNIVIDASDIDEGSLVECFAFLMYLEEIHPTRGNLELYFLSLETDFVLLLRRIVHSEIAGYDVRIASVYQANKLLEYVSKLPGLLPQPHAFLLFSRHLMKYPNTCKTLRKIVQFQDGASLMADVALMVSQTWSPKHHVLRRPSLFFDLHQQTLDTAILNEPPLFLLPQILQILFSNPPITSPDMSAFLSVLSKSLRPIWHRTLSHLRSLDPNKHPGAQQVTKLWTSLGIIVGVHKLVKPLVGCTWVECPRFVKETEEEIAVCARCDWAQYCDEKCQKRWVLGSFVLFAFYCWRNIDDCGVDHAFLYRDWKTHKLICRPAAKKG
jgi:hypothetical protein